MVSTGTVTFTISSTAGADVVPVVFADAADDDNLGLVVANPANALPKAASDGFGLGGRTTFTPPEAGIGAAVVTTNRVDLTNDFYANANFTYFFDANDTFQFGGVAISQAAFESALTVGDIVTTSYNPDAAGSSTHNITTDQPPTAVAAPTVTVVNGDSGPTANDVRVTFTPPAANSASATYTLQRSTVAVIPGPGCTGLPIPGAFADVAGATAAANPDGTRTFSDNNRADGCFQYRVQVTNPVSNVSADGAASTNTTVPAAADTTAPTSVELITTVNGGLVGQLDAGDTFRIGFSEAMGAPVNGDRLRFTDADGTVVDVTCGSGATCTANGAAETFNAVNYATGQIFTIAVTVTPTPVTAGTTPGLAIAATTTVTDQQGFADVAGNAYTSAGADDSLDGA